MLFKKRAAIVTENLFRPMSECKVEVPIPEVDLIFPAVYIKTVKAVLDTVSVSENLTSFPQPETRDIFYLSELGVEISGNLIEPLNPAWVGGKTYIEERKTSQIELPFKKGDGYRRSFRERREGTTRIRQGLSVWDRLFPLLQPPINFKFTPILDLPCDVYPYQWKGVEWLAKMEFALLGDDMGTGKTIQSIIALRCLFQQGKIKSVLIICPRSVLGHWDRELEKWAPILGVTVVRGSKESRKTCWEQPAHVWLTTYDTLRQDIEEVKNLKKDGYDVVIADEVQKIKNPGTGYARSVRQLPCRKRWGLSGTPVENRLEELVSIFQFIKPGLLHQKELAVEDAKRIIKPFFLRRRKEDVLKDLPPKIIYEEWLSLDGQQAEAYKRAEEEGIVYLKRLGEEITVFHILELITRLKQLCNVDAKSKESAKLRWVKDSLEDIVSSGDKVLIYSQYLESGIQWLKEELKEHNPLYYGSELSDPRRKHVEELFKNESRYPIFLATQKTGGLGLNLTSANYVIHFDHWWNPATANQAEDRAHRIGQEKKVFVYHLWVEDSVEERVYKKLKEKQGLYDEVIDSLSNIEGSGLSEDEIFELFSLKKPQKGKIPIEPVRDGFLKLSPKEFEDIVEGLYQKMGYGTRRRPRTRDQGVDIIATRQTVGGVEKIAIQCKRHEDSVGVEVARELLGVINKDNTFTKAVIVSSTSFTNDCRIFCQDVGRLELIDGSRLLQFLNNYQVTW